MMHPILSNILILSLTGSAVAGVMILIRKLVGKNTGAWWRSLIWVLLLIRLCIPVMVETPLGLITPREPMEVATPSVEAVEGDAPITTPHTEVVPSTNHETTTPKRSTFAWHDVVAVLYVVGLGVSLLLFVVRIMVLQYKISKLTHCKDKTVLQLLDSIKKDMGIKRSITLRLKEGSQVPALCGILRPCIILSKKALYTINVMELQHILRHELTHYKQKDIMKLWLMELAKCIHWFNPIIHAIRPIIEQDIELACDERVLMHIDRRAFASYGQVLVKSSVKKQKKHHLMVTTHFAGKRGKKLKERLVMINHYHRGKIITLGIVLALLLATLLVACTTTLAKEQDAPTTTPEATNATELNEEGKPFSEQRIDLIETNGAFVNQMVSTMNQEVKLMDSIEEYEWDKGEGVYKITLATKVRKYHLTLEANDLMQKLDYNTCTLTIQCIDEGWTLTNPSVEEFKDKIVEPFKTEYRAWKDAQPYEETGNYMTVYSLNQESKKIQLDEETAANIVALMEQADEKINAMELSDTDRAFHNQGIWIHLDALKPEEEWGVAVLMNDNGEAAIGKFNEESPVSEEIYNTIMDIVQLNTDWVDVRQDEIYDLMSVELIYNGDVVKTLTDRGALRTIESTVAEAEFISGGTGCPFSATLRMTRADGTTIDALLATDSCSVLVLGSYGFYDYRKGKLPELFGYDSFYDLMEKN